MNFREKTCLGRTGLKVGRLGISSSFGAPAYAYEKAFEEGCNYFSWGTFIKGHSNEMFKAITNIISKGQRENIVISMLSYAHNSYLTRRSIIRKLKKLNTGFIDILLLGYFSKKPSRGIIDGALKLKDQGYVRFLGISTHNRKLIPELEEENLFDVYHTRYNAANRGAEEDVFPLLNANPGIVSFTATRWRQLLKSEKIPKDIKPASAVDCYRFVLSNPAVDVCMMGCRTMEQMNENISTLDLGPLNEEEMKRMKKIGDIVYGRKRS